MTTDKDRTNGEGASAALDADLSPRRSWLPVAIACAVAAVVLGIVLIPGVLRYPDPEDKVLTDEEALAVFEAENEALEEHLAKLQRLAQADVCVADGKYRLPEDLDDAGLMPEDAGALLPPSPESASPLADAVPEGSDYEGNISTLLDRATVLVLRAGEGVEGGTGTGFFITKNRILTNRHVTAFESGARYYIANPTLGRPVPARLLEETPDGPMGAPDFAILEVDTPIEDIVPLGFAPKPAKLEHVIASGFPGLVLESDARFKALIEGRSAEMPESSVTTGIVANRQSGAGADVILHTAQVTPGNSGGPLVDYCGRVVGVNTFIKVKDVGRMSYALGPDDAVSFLQANGAEPHQSSSACRASAVEPVRTAEAPPASEDTSSAPLDGGD